MTGQQIGSVVGYFVGGMYGYPELGSMVGGYLGGVVSPTVIKGPSIGDAQRQTSMAGMSIPKVYGHSPPIAPTLIDGDKIARKVTRRNGGKGSTTVSEQEGFIATRAFLVCEGEIAGYARITRNGKLVYSEVPGDEIDSDSASFASQITIYRGTQTQGPDPSLEAMHGVGNTPYYRGRSYFVVRDDDETQTGGAANQYRIEVVASGTTATGALPTFGAQTDSYTLASDHATFPQEDQPNYMRATDSGVFVAYANPLNSHLAGSQAFIYENLDNHLNPISGSDVEQNGAGYNGYHSLVAVEPKERWSISSAGGGTYCQLFRNGAYCRNLTVGGDTMWWFGIGNYFTDFGGGVWFSKNITGTVVYIAGTESGSPAIVRNRIFKWGVDTGPGDFDPLDTSAVVTAGAEYFTHMDRSGRIWTVSSTEEELIQWDANLTAAQTHTLPAGLTSPMNSFGVNGGYMFIASKVGSNVKVYEIGTWTLVQTIALTGPMDDRNWQVDFNSQSIFVRAGRYVKRIAYAATCMMSLPTGWYQLPDQPNFVSSPSGEMFPICGTEGNRITPDAAIWKDIALDISGRAHPLLPAQLDVDHMTDEVPGFVLGNSTLTGTEYMRTLCTFGAERQVDMSEYDDEVHAVRRGGAIVGTFDTEDLFTVEQEDDDVRGQALKGIKRVTVMYPDPANKYVPTPQTAPRTSPDVTANNNVTIECPIPFDAETMARKADILQKAAFLPLEGTVKRNFRAQYSRYVTSDPIEFDNRRYLVSKASNDDSMVRFELTYDRPSAYTSLAAGSNAPAPSPQTSNTKGPTIGVAFNSPVFRPEDTAPGMQITACGILPGWPGCFVMLSLDSGASFSRVATIDQAGRIGELTDGVGIGSSGEPIIVRMFGSGELDSVTPDQIAAGANAFGIITDELVEIGQFETATEVDDTEELTTIYRPELGTVEAEHFADDKFVMLADCVLVPISREFAGQTLVWRFVTKGTAEANNPTFTTVFNPGEVVHDGGGDPL